MVLPPKPNDIKTGIPLRKPITKLKSELEEKYNSEIPIKKIPPTKIKSPLVTPKTIIKKTIVKAKNVTSNSKIIAKSSKLSKNSQQPTADSTKRELIPQSKSHVIKPTSATMQKKVKKTLPTKKKKSVEGKKSDPMNRLLKITDTEESDTVIMPKRFKTNEAKYKNTIIRRVSKAKKYQKPSIKSEKDLKQDSVASLANHYRMNYLPGERKSVKASNKTGMIKQRKTSTILKKMQKSDEEDITKDAKNLRKKNYKTRRASAGAPNLVA